MGEAERAEAAEVAGRSHGTVSAPAGTKPADAASVKARVHRQREERALVAWARRRGLLLHDENVLVDETGTLVVIDPYLHRLHPRTRDAGAVDP